MRGIHVLKDHCQRRRRGISPRQPLCGISGNMLRNLVLSKNFAAHRVLNRYL